MATDISTTTAERRAQTRTQIDLFVNRFLDGYPYLCRATDISRDGIRLQPIHEPSPAPRYMGLQFQLPGIDEVITASGEAVYADGDEEDGRKLIGVRFTRMPPDAQAVIEQFLAAA